MLMCWEEICGERKEGDEEEDEEKGLCYARVKLGD